MAASASKPWGTILGICSTLTGVPIHRASWRCLRLITVHSNRYGAAFRSHSGRWEPLPGYGTLGEMAQSVVTLLQPYLQPYNY